METSAWCTLLRLCGSKLGVFHTNSYQWVLSKSSVHLSSGFLHSSIHQILMECPVWRPCSKCLGSLSEDLASMEVGLENSRGKVPELFLGSSRSMRPLKLTGDLSCTTQVRPTAAWRPHAPLLGTGVMAGPRGDLFLHSDQKLCVRE